MKMKRNEIVGQLALASLQLVYATNIFLKWVADIYYNQHLSNQPFNTT